MIYCCRLEAASKATRLSNEMTECSSLRRSTVDNDIESDCLEIALSGHRHGVSDNSCCRTVEWLDDVSPAGDGQTRSDALPPPILKNGIKKEVKFCLDVNDENGLKRPQNVYQALPETVILTVCYVTNCLFIYCIYYLSLCCRVDGE